MADDDLPYQQVPQVEQLRQERANAVAYGMTDRVAAIDGQLEVFGAAEKRKAAAPADDEADARSAPPQGRTPRPRQQQA